MCLLSVCRGQKMSDTVELELQVVVRHLVDAGN